MTFLRASEDGQSSRLRRVITAATLTSLAVYSLTILSIAPAQAQSSRTRKAYIKADTAKLRSGPGTGHKTTALLDAGRKAKVVAKKGEWVKLRLESGTEGWVRSDLMAVSKKRTKDHDEETTPRRRRRSSHDEDDKPRRTAKRHTRDEDEAPRRRKVTHVAKAKPKAKPVHKPVSVAKAKPTVHFTPKSIPHTAPSLAVPKPRIVKPVIVKGFVKPPISQADRVLVGPRPVVSKPGEKVLTVTIQPAVKTAPKNPAKVEVKPLPNLEQPKPVVEEQPTTPPPPVEVPTSPPTTEVIPAKAPVQVAQINRATVNRATTRSNRLVRNALAYRGTPYRMGRSGSGAFDCSGFMLHLFKQMGQTLPRTAAEQFHVGSAVDRSRLQPGDLVFFKNTYKRGVSHVGMFIGDGKFIHASSHGGVRTNSLSEDYYLNHWAGARRPSGKK